MVCKLFFCFVSLSFRIHIVVCSFFLLLCVFSSFIHFSNEMRMRNKSEKKWFELSFLFLFCCCWVTDKIFFWMWQFDTQWRWINKCASELRNFPILFQYGISMGQYTYYTEHDEKNGKFSFLEKKWRIFRFFSSSIFHSFFFSFWVKWKHKSFFHKH